MSNERVIWDKLRSAGLTPAGAAGLMGNLYAESGLNPQNLQNSYEKKLGLYNRFARDLDALGDFCNGRKNGFDWCDVFVDWCFVQTFGRELGQRLLGQPDRSCGAGTGYSLNYYKQKGRLFSTPQPGDQIFFGDAKSTWHTGIVVKVSGGYVNTIEDNAGSPSAVRSCRYVIGGKTIKGYGRPDWSLVPEDKPDEQEENDMKYFKTINDVPSYYRAAVDKCVKTGALQGGDGALNVSEDLCRTLMVLDRMGSWTEQEHTGNPRRGLIRAGDFLYMGGNKACCQAIELCICVIWLEKLTICYNRYRFGNKKH